MTSPSRPFEQTVDVETPELVVLSYSIAGIGSRMLAALTDLAICVVLFLLLIAAIVMLGVGVLGSHPRSSSANPMSASVAFAILILLQFVIFWGYYVLFEGLMDGQTPGKRIHRLRVVRQEGYSVGFGVSAARNLVRIIDMQPGFFYLVGMVSMIFTRSGRRLGDLVAGTIVVREVVRRTEAPAVPRARDGHARQLQTSLSEDEYVLLGRLVERWAQIDPTRRAALVAQIGARLGPALDPADTRPLAPRLLELHERERLARARGVASRGEIGAGRERTALIATGSPRWAAFGARLARAQRGGLKTLTEDEVREFVAEYRALSNDFARLRTASAGRALDELFDLGRMVAGAHNLIYRERRTAVRATARFLFADVPREVRRSAGPIALAALLLFGPALISGVALVRDPGLASELVPQSMIERAESGVRRARTGEGYIDDPQLMRPVMASSIISNNVQISFGAFAGGITAGVMTTFLLVFNGLSLGSVAGLYVSKGIGSLLLAFVAPHGVLELSAICIAGGAGFLLAGGILLPGRRTRREALVEQSRRAIRLVAASTVLLLVAGTIEGFISPIEWWPIEGKLAVSGVTAVLMVAWLRGGMATPKREADPERHELALGAAS